MPNLLDMHAEKLKNIVRKYGRPVVLTDPVTETEYPLTMIWNDVQHGIKIDNLNGDPMGEKSSLYVDRDSMFTSEGAEIVPQEGWKATGSPNKYDPDRDYTIRIPKHDFQLPGILLFLEERNQLSQPWTRPADQGGAV